MLRILLLFCVSCLISCSKNIDLFTPLDKIQELNSLFAKLQSKDQSILIESTDKSTTVETQDGSILSIEANAFVDMKGNLIEGQFEILFSKLVDANDYLHYQRNTLSRNAHFTPHVAFKLQFKQGNQELFLRKDKYIRVHMPVVKSNAETINKLFYQTTTESNWSEVEETEHFMEGQYIVQSNENSVWSDYGYSILVDQAGWYSVGSRVLEQNQKLVSFCLDEDMDVDFTNTLTYLLPFDGLGCKVLPYRTLDNAFCDDWKVDNNSKDLYRLIVVKLNEDSTFGLHDSEVALGSSQGVSIQFENYSEQEIIDLLSN